MQSLRKSLRYPLYLWPGLAELWLLRQAKGFLIAVSFGCALTLALYFRFINGIGLPGEMRSLFCAIIAAIWLKNLFYNFRFSPEFHSNRQKNDLQKLFLQSQREYLQGNWVGAQLLLHQLLRESPADVESRLMLATLYRHTKQYDLAEKEISHLKQIDAEGLWQFELGVELKLITKSREEDSTEAGKTQGADIEYGVESLHASQEVIQIGQLEDFSQAEAKNIKQGENSQIGPLSEAA
ncbi:MAG: tetratricopeptide repeat protein [Pirellulaceae bacterium]|nr:tetratricopeptide repeat protein [Pirellulaceae bacterium]